MFCFSFSLEITSFLTPKRISFLENRNLNGLWDVSKKQLWYVYFITIYQLKILYYNAVALAFSAFDIFYVTCHTLFWCKAFCYSVIFTSSAIDIFFSFFVTYKNLKIVIFAVINAQILFINFIWSIWAWWNSVILYFCCCCYFYICIQFWNIYIC